MVREQHCVANSELHWQQCGNCKSNLTKLLLQKQQSTSGPVATTSIFDLARTQWQVKEATEKWKH